MLLARPSGGDAVQANALLEAAALGAKPFGHPHAPGQRVV